MRRTATGTAQAATMTTRCGVAWGVKGVSGQGGAAREPTHRRTHACGTLCTHRPDSTVPPMRHLMRMAVASCLRMRTAVAFCLDMQANRPQDEMGLVASCSSLVCRPPATHTLQPTPCNPRPATHALQPTKARSKKNIRVHGKDADWVSSLVNGVLSLERVRIG
eukprot:353633-Chlamydomonas_euryale.AAC.9